MKNIVKKEEILSNVKANIKTRSNIQNQYMTDSTEHLIPLDIRIMKIKNSNLDSGAQQGNQIKIGFFTLSISRNLSKKNRLLKN